MRPVSPTPVPSQHVDHNYQGQALLVLGIVVLMVVGGLMWAIATSPWMPWIVGAIAIALMVVFAGVPIGCVLTAAGVLAHPRGRRIVITHVREHSERRHQERLAASTPASQQTQHVYLQPGAKLPMREDGHS